MSPNSIKELKSLLFKYEFNPLRERGQNFLADPKILEFIVAAANVTSEDFVVEVGPGAGTLTNKLAEKAKAVLAVEIDPTLTKVLAETTGELDNVRIFKGDALGHDFHQEIEKWKKKNGTGKFKIVANLPYQITSKFLRDFLPRPDLELMVLMIQREVAQRIIAPAGETSLLSLSVQFYSKPEIMRLVGKSHFWPAPEIDSAVIKLDPANGYKIKNKISPEKEKNIFRLMKMGFVARRKQLHNNLSGGLNLTTEEVKKALTNLGLKEQVRAQELTLEQWDKLEEALF